MADEPKVPPSGASSEPPAKAAPSVKPATPMPALKPEPWSSPLLEELQAMFPGAVSEAVIFRGMATMTLGREFLLGICEFLKSDEGGAYSYLVDETAVDYPKREKRFDVIYHLYSFKRNDRLRLKILVGEGERVPSVVGIWPTANWLEREVYDMFGVEYEGHPDMRRILRQDQARVQANLGMKSGQ
jgi:NADH-quinone oxidoreductase subunit C